jgi:hypothetical protein
MTANKNVNDTAPASCLNKEYLEETYQRYLEGYPVEEIQSYLSLRCGWDIPLGDINHAIDVMNEVFY